MEEVKKLYKSGDTVSQTLAKLETLFKQKDTRVFFLLLIYSKLLYILYYYLRLFQSIWQKV